MHIFEVWLSFSLSGLAGSGSGAGVAAREACQGCSVADPADDAPRCMPPSRGAGIDGSGVGAGLAGACEGCSGANPCGNCSKGSPAGIFCAGVGAALGVACKGCSAADPEDERAPCLPLATRAGMAGSLCGAGLWSSL